MNIKTKSIIDWGAAGVAAVALIVIAFFWGCNIDIIATVLCGVLVVAGTALLQFQNKKIKEL